jgi:polyisoprenoid-binding protein YceI
MTRRTSDIRPATQDALPVPAGEWSVDPVRSSASFMARVAGGSVRGRLPLSGGARISATVDQSAACLVASSAALSTGSGLLDRMLVGSGFLEADAFPEITFRSEMLVRVPSGWRAVGQLEVKGREHAMACELAVDPRDPMTITSRWVLDSAWVTSRRVLALGRSIAMTCSVRLQPAA